MTRSNPPLGEGQEKGTFFAHLERQSVLPLIRQALQEDIPFGDVTTQAIVDPKVQGKALFVVKEDGVICGLSVVRWVFEVLDEAIVFSPKVRDGDEVLAGTVVVEVTGRLRALLMGERTALNFLQRLSGVSTLTRRFVQKTKPYGVRIADTRKTTPGWRLLEKYAVRCGGGVNHRFSLSDGVLIKDNHIRVAGSITEAVQRVRQKSHHLLRIGVEVEDISGLREALGCGVDAILLDNMAVERVREAVSIAREWSRRMGKPRPLLEVSGGITLDDVEAYAQTGVDIISVGALTHSAPALNISMELV